MSRFAFLAMPLFLATVLLAESPAPVRYNAKGELLKPGDYREWVYLTSGLGMTYGAVNPPADPSFDNVFVNPESYRAFLKDGKWPDKTIFILEIRGSESHGSINKAGHFQTKVVAIEAAVKDESAAEKWSYFDFGSTATAAAAFPKTARCFSCHTQNAAVDNTFVQFYPTLIEVAKAKGSWKEK